MASGAEGPSSPAAPSPRLSVVADLHGSPAALASRPASPLSPSLSPSPAAAALGGTQPKSATPRRETKRPSRWAAEISPVPRPWGSLADLSFGALASTVQWLMSSVPALHAAVDKFSQDMTQSEAHRTSELAYLTERLGGLEAQAQRDKGSIAELQAASAAAARASAGRSGARARKKGEGGSDDEEPEQPKPRVIVAAPDREPLPPQKSAEGNLVDVLGMREWVLQQSYAKEVDLEVIYDRMEKLQDNGSSTETSVQALDGRLDDMMKDIRQRAKLSDLQELKEDILKTLAERMSFSGDELRRAREAAELRHKSLEEELEALRPQVGKLAAQVEQDRIPEGASRLDSAEAQLRAQVEQLAQLDATRQSNAKNRGGPVTLGALGNVNLEEEVRRLRSTLEVMQGQVHKVMEDQGLATDQFRQSMEFFKRNADASTGGTGEGPVQQAPARMPAPIQHVQGPVQQAPAAAEPPPTQVVQQVVAQPVVAQATVVPQQAVVQQPVVQQAVVQQVVVAQAVPQPPQPQQPAPRLTSPEPPRIPEELLEKSEWWDEERLQAASLEERMEAFVQMQSKMFKAVRHHERQVDILGSKVDDVWGQLPKVVALLEPLQAQALQDKPAAGAEDARSEIQTLRGALSKVLRNTLEDNRAELDRSVAALRQELGGLLGAKAGAQDLAALSSRLDAWAQQLSLGTREASPGPPEPAAGRRKPRGSMTASPDVSGERFHRHDACMVPTCPRSVAVSKSTGRLPELKSPAGARKGP